MDDAIWRGRRPGPGSETPPERRLLCAILTQAIKDASNGDGDALSWLGEVGSDWCCGLFGLRAAPDWGLAVAQLPAAQRELSAWLAERWLDNEWRARHKAEAEGRSLGAYQREAQGRTGTGARTGRWGVENDMRPGARVS